MRAWLQAIFMSGDSLAALRSLRSEKPLREVLRNGELLCVALNALRPGLDIRSKAGPRFVQLENLTSYAAGCRSLGLPEADLLPPQEWLDGSTITPLVDHLRALSAVVSTPAAFGLAHGTRPKRSARQVRSGLSAKQVTEISSTSSVAFAKEQWKAARTNQSAARAFFSAAADARARAARPVERVASQEPKQHVAKSLRMVSHMGATHSFAESETIAFTIHINKTLSPDPDCHHLLPIAEDSLDIFEQLRMASFSAN